MKLFTKIFFYFLLFSIGLFIGFYNSESYFKNYKVAINLISNIKISEINNNLNSHYCEIPGTDKILDNSYAFIGHAYGSPSFSNINNFISPNVESFLNKTSNIFNGIIFTGDVFEFPSINKWERLRQIIGHDVEIFISPGNHDILRPDSKDIFLISEFGKSPFPFHVSVSNTSLIIDDSTSSKGNVSEKLISLANNMTDSKVIIARHHSPIEELLPYVNSTFGISKDPNSLNELINQFEIDKDFYWIIGDGGAFEHLPRLKCIKYFNHTFILNGIGQVKGDTIVIFQNNSFYRFDL